MVAVLSCVQDSDDAGMRGVDVSVVTMLVFVNVSVCGAAGEAGWVEVCRNKSEQERLSSAREGVSSK